MKSKNIFKATITVILALAMILSLAGCGDYAAETLITNTKNVTEEFDRILINTTTSDVYFQPSTDGKVSVVCRESKKVYHNVTVEAGTLVIGEIDTRSDIEKLKTNLSLFTRTIIVYLPLGEYEALDIELDTGNVDISDGYKFASVEIETDTGNVDFESDAAVLEINTDTGIIKVNDITAESIKLDTDIGDVTLEDITADRITVDTDTGDISILYSTVKETLTATTDAGKIQLTEIGCNKLSVTNETGKTVLHSLIAGEEITVNSNVGDIKLHYSDSPLIDLKTTVGSINATILSDKQFEVSTDVGKINVPASAGEEVCKISTEVGDITVIVEKIITVE